MNDDTRKIRETRKKLGWPVQKMAEALVVSKKTIEFYEQGRKVSRQSMKLLDNLIEENGIGD